MIGRFAPPLALMALIFWLSDQPDLGTELGGFDLVLRKLAHMAEYALLFAALAARVRLARRVVPRRLSRSPTR